MAKGAFTIDGLICRLQELRDQEGTNSDTPVVIDCGRYLTLIEDVDLGASDEGVVIWCGDRVE